MRRVTRLLCLIAVLVAAPGSAQEATPATSTGTHWIHGVTLSRWFAPSEPGDGVTAISYHGAAFRENGIGLELALATAIAAIGQGLVLAPDLGITVGGHIEQSDRVRVWGRLGASAVFASSIDDDDDGFGGGGYAGIGILIPTSTSGPSLRIDATYRLLNGFSVLTFGVGMSSR